MNLARKASLDHLFVFENEYKTVTVNVERYRAMLGEFGLKIELSVEILMSVSNQGIAWTKFVRQNVVVTLLNSVLSQFFFI